MQIRMSAARSLCTDPELKLVEASLARNISQLPVSDLKRRIGQARKLQDKWRDLMETQSRNVKAARPDRVGAAHRRSEAKFKLFQEVLQRFEQQLEKTETSASSPGEARASRSRRTAEHRQTRSAVRKDLNERREEHNLASLQASTTPAKEKREDRAETNRGTRMAPEAPEREPDELGELAVEPHRGSDGTDVETPRPRSRRKANAAAATQAARSPRNRQAKAAAKRTRIQESGAHRVHGHVSGRQRRSQGRRDARG